MSEKEETVYLESPDGFKVAMFNAEKELRRYTSQELKDGMTNYVWTEGDVLLCIFTKCGTHMVWEMVQMLLNGCADYSDLPKEFVMVDLIPATSCTHNVPSPKAINTHYRLDVLPEAFQNRKTITVVRNVKDHLVSRYFHNLGQWKMIKSQAGSDFKYPTLEEYIDSVIEGQPLHHKGFFSYFTFHEHMLKRKDDNILFLVFEDIVRDPVANVRKIDAFLGTNANEELILQISDASDFNKMKAGKAKSERLTDAAILAEEFEKKIEEKDRFSLFRSGKIGGWKNYITVAQNERIDAKLKKWIAENDFQDMPFIYE